MPSATTDAVLGTTIACSFILLGQWPPTTDAALAPRKVSQYHPN